MKKYDGKMPLISFFNKVAIGRADDPIMIRWNIIGIRGLFTLRLHKFIRSDHDCLHDHPWDFYTLILKGGYYEKVECSVTKRVNGKICRVPDFAQIWRKPGTLIFHKAEHRHSVQLKSILPEKSFPIKSSVQYMPSWSLVLSFKPRRKWGFWQKGIWTEWFKFDSQNNCD